MRIVQTLQRFTRAFGDEHLKGYLEAPQGSGSGSRSELAQSFRFIVNKSCQAMAFLALNTEQAANMMPSVFQSCAALQLSRQLSALWLNIEILNAFALEFQQQHVAEATIQKTRQLPTTRYKQPFLAMLTAALRSQTHLCLRHRIAIYQTNLVPFARLYFMIKELAPITTKPKNATV